MARLWTAPTAAPPRGSVPAATAAIVAELVELQERLYAEGVGGGHRSLLLLLQGMDTSGKDGTVRHVMRGVSPAGVRVVRRATVKGRSSKVRRGRRPRRRSAPIRVTRA